MLKIAKYIFTFLYLLQFFDTWLGDKTRYSNSQTFDVEGSGDESNCKVLRQRHRRLWRGPIHLRGLRSVVTPPAGSRAEPRPKMDFVHCEVRKKPSVVLSSIVQAHICSVYINIEHTPLYKSALIDSLKYKVCSKRSLFKKNCAKRHIWCTSFIAATAYWLRRPWLRACGSWRNR